MPMFASTTTSGYSDPMKALSIKALEQRMKDMQAQQAAQQPDAAMMATIPGGIGHVLGQVGDSFKEMRGQQTLAANKEELARTMAGIDPEKGPTPQQGAVIARLAPEIFKDYMDRQHQRWTTEKTDATARRGQDQTLAGIREGHGVQREGHGVTREGQQLQAGVAREGHGVTREGQQLQADVAREGQQLQAGVAREGHGVTREGQQLQAGVAREGHGVTREGQQLQADVAREGHGVTREGQQLQAGVAREGHGVTREGQQLQADVAREGHGVTREGHGVTREGQQLQADVAREGHGIQREGNVIASSDRQAKIASDERIAASTAAAKAAELAGDPKRAEAVLNFGTQYARQTQAVDKLEKAVSILNNGGINTGPWARAETATAMITDGRFGGSKEMAQRTTDFNSIVNEASINAMAETLKGQTTNFEMEKFLEVMNNPNSSPEARIAGINRLLAAAKVGRDLTAEALKKSGGNIDIINTHLGRSGGAPAGGGGGGAPAAGTKAPPTPEFVETSLNNARAAIQRNPANKPAIIQRLKENGISTEGL